MIIYIHGFGSNGLASKANMLRQYCAKQQIPFLAPSLSTIPTLAISTLQELIEQWLPHGEVKLIGSSLGGFYAMYLAHKYNLPVVLVNPSMTPGSTLLKKIGECPSFYDLSSYHWTAEHVHSLENYKTSFIGQNCLLLVQTGDDVLDYNVAVEKLPDAQHIIEQGGDHGFAGFERVIAQVVNFLHHKI